METRIYFNRKEVLKKLEKHKIVIGGNKDEYFYSSKYGSTGGCVVKGSDAEPDLAYLIINDYVQLEVHHFLKDLEVVKITIFDTLLKEENLHIEQGTGKEGKSTWSITYGDDSFEAPTASCGYASACIYRSIIRIRIVSTDLQSAKECYNKIRQGEMENTWKGESAIPSHCGSPLDIQERY